MAQPGAVTVVLAAQSFDPSAFRVTREALDLTQEEIGADLGVTQATVSRWEMGVNRPRGQALVAYVTLMDRLRDLAAAVQR